MSNQATKAILAAFATLLLTLASGCTQQPEAFDQNVERVPVVNEAGKQVGTIPSDAIDEVAATGDRVEVLDDDGNQVGWFTTDGFEPLGDG